METKRRAADYYRHRDRSPSASRYDDRSSDRYTDRSSDRYKSSRHRDRSRSRSGSYSRSKKQSNRYRSKSRNRSDRRSTSKGRCRSRSRSPRRYHQSSRYYSSRSRHSRRSRSNSASSPTSRPYRSSNERTHRRSSPVEELVAPPPPSFTMEAYEQMQIEASTSKNSGTSNKSESTNGDVKSKFSSSSSKFLGTYATLYDHDDSSSEKVNVQGGEFDEPIDKERIHREMEEKLRQALAKEGKIYPPPKPEPSHPVFANDGSFLEIFKKMQEQMAQQQANAEAAELKRRNQPVCKRRGGKILKTGIVAKSRASDGSNVDPKDFWSIYLQEVNKYKNSSCDVDSKTRPLVK